MRGSTWMALAMMAAALAACSPKQQAAAPAPVAPAATPAATPAPVAAEQLAVTAEATPAAAETPAATPAPPPPEIVRFSPGDYPAQERRIDGLIANAVSRDTTGETQQDAAEARAQRARCTTKTCIKRSYAAEEAKLRRWEGSADVN